MSSLTAPSTPRKPPAPPLADQPPHLTACGQDTHQPFPIEDIRQKVLWIGETANTKVLERRRYCSRTRDHKDVVLSRNLWPQGHSIEIIHRAEAPEGVTGTLPTGNVSLKELEEQMGQAMAAVSS